MDNALILSRLAAQGLINPASAVVEPLTGGVSSDICLIRDGQQKLVVKQALAQLRVKAEWFADPVRNRYEQAYISFVEGVVPDAVPHILYSDEELSFFAMEFLAPPLENWKTRLLQDPGDSRWAARAGDVLGKIHAASWENAELKARFDTTVNFHELRSDPYFLYTAGRHPDVSERMRAATATLECNRRCLVHGDYSPKNILVSDTRLVALDCEVAWFGDPAFDVGFLLNHLFLKALHRPQQAADYLALAELFWSHYSACMGSAGNVGAEAVAGVERSLGDLLPMLMLARVDGKSPVEYLNPAQQEIVRKFTLEKLKAEPLALAELRAVWLKTVQAV